METRSTGGDDAAGGTGPGSATDAVIRASRSAPAFSPAAVNTLTPLSR